MRKIFTSGYMRRGCRFENKNMMPQLIDMTENLVVGNSLFDKAINKE